MSIEIQGLPGGLVQNTGDTTQTARPQGPTAGQTGNNPAPARDTFSMTESATRLRHLEGTIASLPVVDAQRVESVQRAMATGSFTVDPASSADKMLEMERNLP